MKRFLLPDLLRAERAGRILAIAFEEVVSDAFVTPTLRGAAVLAACRHLHNHGKKVRVSLPESSVRSEVFAIMREVLVAMGCLLEQRPSPLEGDKTNLIAGDSLPGKDAIGIAEKILDTSPLEYERKQGIDKTPFLRVGRREDALPAEEVRRIDRMTVEEYHLPSLCLMENAGLGASLLALSMLNMSGQGPVVILVGYGNNGGDALVVARELCETGISVKVLFLDEPGRLRGDAGVNYEILTSGIEKENLLVIPDNVSSFSPLTELLEKASLIVDGIFGTGLRRRVEGKAAEIIQRVNASPRPVLALDLPSGLHADTGEEMGICIRATCTVTFAVPKHGLFQGLGPAVCGEIWVADIGFPRELLDLAQRER